MYVLQCTAGPLKCIGCKHTAASQCRCSVQYTAVRSVYEVWIHILCKVGNKLQVKHNVPQGRAQCPWEWSAMCFKRSISMKCTEHFSALKICCILIWVAKKQMVSTHCWSRHPLRISRSRGLGYSCQQDLSTDLDTTIFFLYIWTGCFIFRTHFVTSL